MVSVAKAEDPYGFVALLHSLYRTLSHRRAANLQGVRPKRDRKFARGMRDRSAIDPPQSSGLVARTDVLATGKSAEIAGMDEMNVDEKMRGSPSIADGCGCAATARRKIAVDVRRVGWPARGPGENRVTVARTAGDHPLNTRRSSCHARFMGRQRNHTSTRNLPSLAAPAAPFLPPLSSTAPLRGWPRCDAHSIPTE